MVPFSMLYVLALYTLAYNSHICTDALAIYLLNLLLAFLQPKFDPSLQEDLMADDMEGGGDGEATPLPSQRDDEFRPFVRRLPEWQFWCVPLRRTRRDPYIHVILIYTIYLL